MGDDPPSRGERDDRDRRVDPEPRRFEPAGLARDSSCPTSSLRNEPCDYAFEATTAAPLAGVASLPPARFNTSASSRNPRFFASFLVVQ